jgi:hypothetical protein
MYLWRMTEKDRWLAYDSARHPMPDLDDDATEQVIPLPHCAYYAEARAEADRMNRGERGETQMGLGI